MKLREREYKKTVRGIIGIQRMFRNYKMRKFFLHCKMEARKRAVLVVQRYVRGYLAYNKYYARLKGTMTKKNLDYIIHRYADAKEFMRECLQVQLAYLVRKRIKRKAIEAELKRKADLAEKKRIAREKELERLRKIHEERKEKKRKVRAMLAETVAVCFKKEDKRREDVLNKQRKQQANQVGKKPPAKADIAFDSVTLAFK